MAAPAVTPEEFIDVLKTQAPTDYIKGLIPAGGNGHFNPVTAMIEKGDIVAMDEITETGIYEGVDVTDAPVRGAVLIMASPTSSGDMGYFLMDDKMDLYIGGNPAATNAYTFTKVLSDKPNVVIGDGATAEAQLTLHAKDKAASHVVFQRAGENIGSIGVIQSDTDQLVIEQRKPAHILFHLPADQIIRAKIGNDFHTLAMLDDLERPEVVSPYTNTPTKDELKTAFKKLPAYLAADAAGKDEFWKGSHDFYVKDDPQTKMLLVKYRGVSNSTETAPGNFFFEKLTLAS